MPGANLNHRWARAIIGRLCCGGAREAIVCPGSRSTPLALACAEQPGLRTWSVIDERSAGFFALGIAKHSGAPVILVATSGTAPAHFYPAIIEASLSSVPLVVLSADRPWELHGFGAPQTIDQQQLFGRYVRRFEALPLPDASVAVHLAAVVDRALHAALSAPRGPVHLNVPFREPLAPIPDGGPELAMAAPTHFARGDRSPTDETINAINGLIEQTREGLIVCGPRDADDGFAEAIHRLSAATGYPIFAEAASQVRSLPSSSLVTHYDGILRNASFAEAHRPKLILRFGGGITSKRLQTWIDNTGAELILFSDEGELFDPAHAASRVVTGNTAEIARRLADGSPRVDGGAWRRRFATAQSAANAVISDEQLRTSEALTEPAIAREVVRALPPGATLFVSSSMPIRDVDAFAGELPGVRVLSNRGANGIDGVVASALGASVASGRPTALLLGDVAFLHDLGSLLIAARNRVPLTVVIANNDGGGIFSFLPIAKHPDHFEQLFGTPHGMSFEKAAELYGARYVRPATAERLREAVVDSLERGLTLIEVKTPSRRENVAVHDALGERLAAAIGQGPWA